MILTYKTAAPGAFAERRVLFFVLPNTPQMSPEQGAQTETPQGRQQNWLSRIGDFFSRMVGGRTMDYNRSASLYTNTNSWSQSILSRANYIPYGVRAGAIQPAVQPVAQNGFAAVRSANQMPVPASYQPLPAAGRTETPAPFTAPLQASQAPTRNPNSPYQSQPTRLNRQGNPEPNPDYAPPLSRSALSYNGEDNSPVTASTYLQAGDIQSLDHDDVTGMAHLKPVAERLFRQLIQYRHAPAQLPRTRPDHPLPTEPQMLDWLGSLLWRSSMQQVQELRATVNDISYKVTRGASYPQIVIS